MLCGYFNIYAPIRPVRSLMQANPWIAVVCIIGYNLACEWRMKNDEPRRLCFTIHNVIDRQTEAGKQASIESSSSVGRFTCSFDSRYGSAQKYAAMSALPQPQIKISYSHSVADPTTHWIRITRTVLCRKSSTTKQPKNNNHRGLWEDERKNRLKRWA